jgi:hypothetical protein
MQRKECDMIDVSVREDEVDVNISGMDRMFALSRGFEFPLSHVHSVTQDARAGRRMWNGFRSPGTSVPGGLSEGRYRHGGRTDFVCVRHRGPALALELHDEPFDRVIVEVPDVEKSVGEIRQALADMD